MSYSNLDNVPTQIAGTSELLASDWNTYVKDNFDALKYGHLVFADSTARNAGIGSPIVGIMVFLSNESGSEVLQVYGGSGWRAAVNTPSIVDLAVTTGKINALAVTTAKIDALAVTTAKIDDNAVTQVKMADNSVGTAEIIAANVTYPKLGDDVKKFSVATSATAGLYFTSSGNLTAASLARNATQQPLVVVNSSSAVVLYLPYNLGSIGDVITVTSVGLGATEIQCLFDGPGSTGPAFFGSATAEFTQVGGVIMLICISDNGSGPFGGTRDWLVVGDYLLD